MPDDSMTTDKPPLDYHFEEDGHADNKILGPAVLFSSAVAAGIALAACAALYYAPETAIAFAAGVATALWFTPGGDT